MKKILSVVLFLALIGSAFSQQPYGKIVVGIEASSDLITYTDGVSPLPAPAVQIDVPVGKFSLGTAFSYHNFKGGVTSSTYLNRREPMLFAGQKVLAYAYEDKTVDANYWSVPLRLQYRLPCNCAFIHAATVFDFWRGGNAEYQKVLREEAPDDPESEIPLNGGIRKILKSYELGVGFKLHFNDYMRVVLRPAYVWSERPDLSDGNDLYRTLRMSVGLQYAFVRYGGRF